MCSSFHILRNCSRYFEKLPAHSAVGILRNWQLIVQLIYIFSMFFSSLFQHLKEISIFVKIIFFTRIQPIIRRFTSFAVYINFNALKLYYRENNFSSHACIACHAERKDYVICEINCMVYQVVLSIFFCARVLFIRIKSKRKKKTL